MALAFPTEAVRREVDALASRPVAVVPPIEVCAEAGETGRRFVPTISLFSCRTNTHA